MLWQWRRQAGERRCRRHVGAVAAHHCAVVLQKQALARWTMLCPLRHRSGALNARATRFCHARSACRLLVLRQHHNLGITDLRLPSTLPPKLFNTPSPNPVYHS